MKFSGRHALRRFRMRDSALGKVEVQNPELLGFRQERKHLMAFRWREQESCLLEIGSVSSFGSVTKDK
jgi:hypothetical protein